MKYFYILLFAVLSAGEAILIQPSSPSCDDDTPPSLISSPAGDSIYLEAALTNITSNSILVLAPGCHRLSKITPVIDKINITLTGKSLDAADTIITCEEGIGLVFLNITGLQFSYLAIVRCGMTGDSLKINIYNMINEFVPSFDLTFEFDGLSNISVILGHINHAELEGVHINETKGIGLLAVNVLGNFTVISSIFSNNKAIPYEYYDSVAGAGGGLVVLYNQVKPKSTFSISELTVVNSTFDSNLNYGIAAKLEINYFYSKSSISDYSVDGGGGLSVLLVQQRDYVVHVKIEKCTFSNNMANYGGGILIGSFVDISNTTVLVNECLFKENGHEPSELHNTHATFGQGIAILKDLPYPKDNGVIVPIASGNKFLITNSDFVNNVATSAPGLIYLSLYISNLPLGSEVDQLLIERCSFRENTGFAEGGAMVLREDKASGVQGGISISVSDCDFVKNVIKMNHRVYGNLLSVVRLDKVYVTFRGKMNFTLNSATPVHLHSSLLSISDNTYFVQNSASNGGGIAITSGSNLILNSNCSINFIDNVAFSQGGAIFFYPAVSYFGVSDFDCFLFFEDFDISCDITNTCANITSLNITISFSNNEASSGSIVYGATLKSCPWVRNTFTNEKIPMSTTVYRALQELSVMIIHDEIDDNTFTTPINRIDTDIPDDVVLMPGQLLNITVTSYDHFNKPSSSVVSSHIDDDKIRGQQRSYLGSGGSSGFDFIHGQVNDTILLYIKSTEEPTEETMLNVSIYPLQTNIESKLPYSIKLRDCYPGFEFDNESSSTYKSCICSRTLSSTIECDPADGSFKIPNLFWIGTVDNQTQHVIVAPCIYDYCYPGIKTVNDGLFEMQCRHNRTGLLCGQCRGNLSLQLGSDACVDYCENYYLLLLIYFILAGFIVYLLIGFFGITVSHGYFNIIVFYCNVIVPFQPYILDISSNYFVMFGLSVVNLDVGFPICFFKGMNALDKAYLSFIFPIYLYSLLGFFTLIARCEKLKRKMKWLNENAAAVFGSVMMLSYTSLLHACWTGLSVINLNDNRIHDPWRWNPDPSVSYWRSDHIPLFIMSVIILLVFIIPVSIFLLFPALTLRTRFGIKFIPIYDAMWAPFRDKLQFWIGMRLILRAFPLIFALFTPFPLNVCLLGGFTIIYLFVHASVQPYKGKAQNILEAFLLMNILLLVIGSLYNEYDSRTDDEFDQLAYSTVVIVMAYFAFLLVTGYHLYWKFEIFQRFYKRSNEFILKRYKILRKNKSFLISNSYQNLENDSIQAEENTPPQAVNFTILREPLLESGETTLQNINKLE
jgi:hypothetical protein